MKGVVKKNELKQVIPVKITTVLIFKDISYLFPLFGKEEVHIQLQELKTGGLLK